MCSARRSPLLVCAFFAGAAIAVTLAGKSNLAAQTSARSTPTGRVAEAPPKPGDIDLKRSRIFVKVGKTGLGHEHGVIGRFKTGHVELDAAQQAGEMVFDMTTFVADTEEARRYVGLEGATDPATADKVTHNMTGADVLDVRKFPTATFAINSVLPAKEQKSQEGTQYILDGKFTLRGVTQPLWILATAIPQRDGSQRLRGGFLINQTSFGITPYSTAFGAIGVADRLTIYGELFLVGPLQTAVRSR
ncbi:hypothetical protein GC176_05410 [bacterium]|nr:hypothetical protein [bacterium]